MTFCGDETIYKKTNYSEFDFDINTPGIEYTDMTDHFHLPQQMYR